MSSSLTLNKGSSLARLFRDSQLQQQQQHCSSKEQRVGFEWYLLSSLSSLVYVLYCTEHIRVAQAEPTGIRVLATKSKLARITRVYDRITKSYFLANLPVSLVISAACKLSGFRLTEGYP